MYGDGSMYVGEWQWGAPHGRGVMTSAQGVFRGMYKLGKRSGKGVFRTPQGDEYNGEWAEAGRFFDNTGRPWCILGRSSSLVQAAHGFCSLL